MESNLFHGPGDFLGKPFRLRQDQKAFIYRCYELRPDGHRRWKRVVRGRPKGDGKTELTAAIALAEFAGPVLFAGWTSTGKPRGKRRQSPNIPVAAASFNQADELFAAATEMVKGVDLDGIPRGPLFEFFDLFDTEILFKIGVGRLYRVAAVAGTNDGGKPSFAAIDETHELTGNKRRVHLVLTGGLSKRTDCWVLEITTAGAVGSESIAEDAYKLGQLIEGGHVDQGDTLIDWLAADEHWDLEDDVQLEAAIRESNPAADVFFPVSNLISKYHDPAVPHHEFRRYNLNQWVETTGESWLDEYPGVWDACAGPVEFDSDGQGDGAAVITVDFAQKRDGVAVVVCQLGDDDRIRVWARIWELAGQRIDVAGAMMFIRATARAIPVRAIGYDPHFFELPAQDLQDEGLPMVEFPQTGERMIPACGTALEVIRDHRVVHNGDPVLGSHVRRAVWRDAEGGPRLSKTKSKHRIDGCIAMVMGIQLVLTPGLLEGPPPATARVVSGGPTPDLFRPTERLRI